MIDFKIYTSYKELPESWNIIVCDDIMLKIPYLKALEYASPNNITLYYVGVFKNESLVGIAIVQRVQLYLKDMFRTYSPSLKSFLRNTISSVLKGNILVVGNLTHTGQHGICYLNKELNAKDFLTTIFNALEALKFQIKTETQKTIRLILFKDYFSADKIHEASNIFNSEKFNKVTVQPNMILYIKNDWNKMENYLNLLNKKYRTRYKRARKKLVNIERRELDIEALRLYTNQLHELYLNVSDQAKFNTFILPEHHFYNLKQQLGDNFKVFGYYLNNTLIGFYTLILNNENLETYFLGYDSEHQYNNQAYLNMLYDMLDFAIENGFRSVIYARTAMEIKSSVGAKAMPMTMYIKHTNGFANTLLRAIFNFMKPNQKWEERHPFIN